MLQGSSDWLKWRKTGIGSSDAPVIMGVSPWKTPYQLWEEKTGRTEEGLKTNQFILDRGQRLERVARAHYQLLKNINSESICVTNDIRPHLIASLDGLNIYDPVGKWRALEIKHVGKEDFENALIGIVPEKYYPQLQHILAVTNAPVLDYFSITEKEECCIIEVKPNEAYLQKYLKKVDEFWEMVMKDESPPFSDKDFKKIPPALRPSCEQYLKLKEKLDSLEKAVKYARDEILAHLPEMPRYRGYGMQINSHVRKGTVDYKKIPELQNIDLEPYRKKSTTVTEIRIHGQDSL